MPAGIHPLLEIGLQGDAHGMSAGKPGLPAGGVADICGVGAAWSTARIDGGHVDLPRLSGIMAVWSGESSKNPIAARAKRGQTRGWLPTGLAGARPSQLAVCLRNNVMTIIVFNRAYHSEYRYTTAFYWRARSVSNAFRL